MANEKEQYAIFRCIKISDYGRLGSALAHANRNRETPNANQNIENQYLVQVPFDEIKDRCEKARTRKNNALCYDIVFTASPEFFSQNGTSGKVFDEWQHSTIEWLEQNFGKENIVNLVVHHDETTPHISVQSLPIFNGKLNARMLTGGKAKMSALQTSYAKAVEHLGLKRGIEGSLAKHESIRKYYGRIASAEADPNYNQFGKEPPKRKAPNIEPLIEKEPPDNGVFRNEDPKKYLKRTYESHIAPYIQKILDENRELRGELQKTLQNDSGLRRELSHWRSARSWSKRKAEQFQKLQSNYNIISRDRKKLEQRNKELEQDMAIVKKLNPKLAKTIENSHYEGLQR